MREIDEPELIPRIAEASYVKYPWGSVQELAICESCLCPDSATSKYTTVLYATKYCHIKSLMIWLKQSFPYSLVSQTKKHIAL